MVPVPVSSVTATAIADGADGRKRIVLRFTLQTPQTGCNAVFPWGGAAVSWTDRYIRDMSTGLPLLPFHTGL